jgi:predicted HAD superfamily hydrolase
VDLTHNWSVGCRIRHDVEVRQYFFLRDLKEENVIVAKWISGDNNSSDIMFTKNLGDPLFENS